MVYPVPVTRHRSLDVDHRAPGIATAHRAPGMVYPVPFTRHRSLDVDHQAPGIATAHPFTVSTVTRRRSLCAERRASDTGHQSYHRLPVTVSAHRVPGMVYPVPGTAHQAPITKRRSRAPGRKAITGRLRQSLTASHRVVRDHRYTRAVTSLTT